MSKHQQNDWRTAAGRDARHRRAAPQDPTLFDGILQPGRIDRANQPRQTNVRALAGRLAAAIGRDHAQAVHTTTRPAIPNAGSPLQHLARRLDEVSRSASPDLVGTLREWIDRQYMAALLDGEGSISLKPIRKRRDGRWELMTEVTLSNTHRPTLQFLQAQYGGTLRRKHNKHRSISRLEWHRQADVQALLAALIPYLRIKRRQAELMLEYLRHRGVGRPVPYTPKDWRIADRLYVQNARSRYPGPLSVRPTERRRREGG